MIKCQLCLLARGVIRDAETNSISVFRIIEEFRSSNFPIFVHELAFFASFIRDDDDPTSMDNTLRLRIEDVVLIPIPVTSNFEDKKANRLIVSINALLLPQPGLFTAELQSQDGTIIAHYEVRLSLIEKQPRLEVKTDSSSTDELDSAENIIQEENIA